MKKKIVCFVITLITMLVGGYSVYTSQNSDNILSGLRLANMEILANAEFSGNVSRPCYRTVGLGYGERYYVTYCGACGISVECTSASDTGICTLYI